MSGPRITVDLEQIEKNTRAVTTFCADRGISVTGVTKATCGMPQVARAMIRGGIKGIGESRLENIQRMRIAGIYEPLTLLRIPPLSEVDDIVLNTDISLNSELPVLQALSDAAVKRNLIHDVILMVDLGDLREGIWPDNLIHTVHECLDMPGIHIKGLGTNLTCYGGVLPSASNMTQLVDWAHRIEDAFSYRIEIISGGNSSSLPLIAEGKMPGEINHLRVGEAILLGRETVNRTCWPGTGQTSFLVSAEIIELKKKPSVPIGETGEDAFGKRHVFENKGNQLRAILNIGREDVDVDGLKPEEEGMEVLGASSDHLLLDVSSRTGAVQLGDRISFIPAYSALLAAMTSEYVIKTFAAGDRYGEKRVFTADESNFRLLKSDHFFESSRHNDLVLWEGEKSFSRKETAESLLIMNRRTLPEIVDMLSAHSEKRGLLWLSPRPELGADGFLRYLLTGEHNKGCIITENTVLMGIQEASPEEAEYIHHNRIKTFTMEDIDPATTRQVLTAAVRRAASGTGGIILCYDPSLSDRGQRGLTDRETHLTMEILSKTGLIRAFAWLCPPDNVRGTERAFLLSALGKRIL